MFSNIIKSIHELMLINIKFIKKAYRGFKYQQKITPIKINYNKYEDFLKKMKNEYKPCFVLSTGRCGTAYLTKILQEIAYLDVYHTPNPEFIYYNKFAYEINIKEKRSELLEHIFQSCRLEQIENAYIFGKKYIETSNWTTFYAYQIKKIFPKAQFIHLVRNPAEVIRSGLVRNWYTGVSNYDKGRITPINNKSWTKISDTKKIAWLWAETNQFIEKFKQTLNNDSIITIKSENLFKKKKTLSKIFDFLNIKNQNITKILKKHSKPINGENKYKLKKQKNKYNKELVKKELKLAQQYGYQI